MGKSENHSLSPLVMIVLHVNIVFSNGLEVSHHNLSYQSLCGMIEKMFAFMSKNRQLMKWVRYENRMYMLNSFPTAI